MDISDGKHKNKSIKSVQVLRGVAATAVVFFHTHVILVRPEYGGVHALETAAKHGWLGVNLFFVISGFVIFYAHEHDIGKPHTLLRYAWRRAVRLYPIYWIFLTAFITAAAFGFGYPEFKWEPRHLISAYLLIALVDLPTLPLKVAWTLLFEVKFYALFSLFLISKRFGIAVFAVWTVAIFARNSVAPTPDWAFFAEGWGLLNVWNLYFVMGMLTCWSVARISDQNGPWLLSVGLVLLGTLISTMQGGMDSNLRNPFLVVSLGIAFSLIIFGSVACELRYAWQPPSWAMLLGDASYSVYLVHSAFISLASGLAFKHFDHSVPGPLLFSLIFIGAVLSGIFAHLVIERPVLSMLRKFSPDGEKTVGQSLRQKLADADTATVRSQGPSRNLCRVFQPAGEQHDQGGLDKRGS